VQPGLVGEKRTRYVVTSLHERRLRARAPHATANWIADRRAGRHAGSRAPAMAVGQNNLSVS
jgi:hypothetical protein